MTAPPSKGLPDPPSSFPSGHHKRFWLGVLALLPLGVVITVLSFPLLRGQEPAHIRHPAARSLDSVEPRDQDTADIAPSLLLRACDALEQSRFDDAQAAISRLRLLAPERPEPRLLEKLLVQRRALLAPGWGRAFLGAWAESGRPDLRDSPLLSPALHPNTEAPPAITDAWQRASDEARLILAMATPSLSEAQARWLLQYIPTLDDSGQLVALLDPRRPSMFPDVLRSDIQALLLRRLRWLSKDTSRAMLPRLALLLSGTRGETPFTAQELETLEIISTLPVWRETSFSQTFLLARRHLRESGFPDASTRAFGLAEQTVGSGVALLLNRRAETSWAHLSLEDQRWLGRMLWRIGQRMADASSLLEHSVGTLLMESGAERMGQMCDLEQARKRDDMVREGLRASLEASIERWPLPSLQEELESSRARDELTWLRAFSGHADLP